LPNLTLLRLMNDHTGAFAQAIRGVNTPELRVADNDYAVGLVVDKVAHSPYAKSTLIFVVEDDAQDRPDHVDAHRSIALIAGPYVKQGQLVSERYSTVSLIRTIEEILGLPAQNLHDAGVRPMIEIFDPTRTGWTYTAAPSPLLQRPRGLQPVLWQGTMGDKPYPAGRSGLDLRRDREALLPSAGPSK
jgi:hypothetical protein